MPFPWTFPARSVGWSTPTDAIESINYQLRKVSKNRGQFPNDAAAYGLLYLAICDIEVRTTTRGGRK